MSKQDTFARCEDFELYVFEGSEDGFHTFGETSSLPHLPCPAEVSWSSSLGGSAVAPGALHKDGVGMFLKNALIYSVVPQCTTLQYIVHVMKNTIKLMKTRSQNRFQVS